MTTGDSAATDPAGRVEVTPALIQAARLRVTINDRRGVPTEPAIRALALTRPATAVGRSSR
jgi:hypothetical protein